VTSARVVVKVNAPGILHKSDVGGVTVVSRDSVNAALAEMESRFANADVAGYTVHDFIDYERAPGHELLLGVRWTDDFGPVVILGAGGVHAEFMASNLRDDRAVTVMSAVAPASERRAAIDDNALAALATRAMRGQAAAVDGGAAGNRDQPAGGARGRPVGTRRPGQGWQWRGAGAAAAAPRQDHAPAGTGIGGHRGRVAE
jgi:hypothetical protein